MLMQRVQAEIQDQHSLEQEVLPSPDSEPGGRFEKGRSSTLLVHWLSLGWRKQQALSLSCSFNLSRSCSYTTGT